MKKQTEILNYIRQKCLNGDKLSIREIAKQFGTSNRHLATAEELGYIQKVGPNLYKWKVGEVIPVMAKAMKEKIADYYKDHRYKKTKTSDIREQPADMNKVVTVKYNEDKNTIEYGASDVNDVEKQVQSVIQDCDFWERMYNDLKARHEDVMKTNKELIEISGRDDERINDLRAQIELLKSERDFLKAFDDGSHAIIDGLKSDVTRHKVTIVHRDAEIDRLMNELERQPQPKKKRWDFTLFGLPIFGTYEK